jgi:hypothetical protein
VCDQDNLNSTNQTLVPWNSWFTVVDESQPPGYIFSLFLRSRCRVRSLARTQRRSKQSAKMEAQVIDQNLPSTSKRQPSLVLKKYNGESLSPQIPVYLPHNLSSQQFLELFPSQADNRPEPAYGFSALNDWFSRLVQNLKLQHNEAHPHHKRPYALKELRIEAADWFGKERLGFMKIQSRVSRGDGHDDWVPGAVFLRGGSVAILVSLLISSVVPHDLFMSRS